MNAFVVYLLFRCLLASLGFVALLAVITALLG